MIIQNKEEFATFVENVKKINNYTDPIGFAIARVDRGQINSDKILQASYPVVNWKENYGSAAVFISALIDSGIEIDFNKSEFVATITKEFVQNCIDKFNPFLKEAKEDAHKNVQVIKYLNEQSDLNDLFRVVFIFDDVAPKSVEAVYLKLYALSLAKADLRSLNLDGAFGILENVAWSGNTPIELDWLRANEISLKLNGKYPNIDSVDKFPRFLQHIIPANNTRILDSSKVRFGAQLHPGTTVMPGASYINFNAGTTGAVMVEGRISSSAIVADGSDIGGGASILGVLSGTDGNPISIGKNSLLGANSVTGIPLGDGCIVDAGVTILAGTKIEISQTEIEKINQANDKQLESKTIFKGAELAGLNGIHFRQDSLSGIIKAYRSTREIRLNQELH